MQRLFGVSLGRLTITDCSEVIIPAKADKGPSIVSAGARQVDFVATSWAMLMNP